MRLARFFLNSQGSLQTFNTFWLPVTARGQSASDGECLEMAYPLTLVMLKTRSKKMP
jgi:hypothetical protein